MHRPRKHPKIIHILVDGSVLYYYQTTHFIPGHNASNGIISLQNIVICDDKEHTLFLK